MRRRSIARLIALAVGGGAAWAGPARLAAQEAIHIYDPLVEFIVSGDTTSNRVRVVANLSMTTSPAPDGELRSTRFEAAAVQVLEWSALERRLVDSLGGTFKPEALSLVGITLDGLTPGTFVGVGADPARAPDSVFFFMLVDTASLHERSGPRHGWRIAGTLAQIDTLLGALHVVARDVTDRHLTVQGSAGGACDSLADRAPHGSVAVLDSVDTAPRLLHHGVLRYPHGATVGTGRVTLKFVIDTAGRVDLHSACVKWSDDVALTAAAMAVLPTMRFVPATLHGRPVAVLVEQAFVFQ